MLAHSPPLPLVMDYLYRTAEDEEGIILALQLRDRVRGIRLEKPVPIWEKLAIALDGEFPILEYLNIVPQLYPRRMIEKDINSNLPETFRAPHLRHLFLRNFNIPIESPFITTMGNLIALSLSLIPPSAYFHPNSLLQQLSLMPQLEILGVTFDSYYPSGDIQSQLSRTPITTRVALPNLRWMAFQGASAYLEALLPWVSMPVLHRLQVFFFNQLTYSIPHLQQLLGATGDLRLNTATLTFNEECFHVMGYPHKGVRTYTLEMELGSGHLDWQVASAAQVIHTLKSVFSAVEHLALEYGRHSTISLEWNNEADRSQWRELLGLFDKVKTLVVDEELNEQVSRSLQPGEGESIADLLPELHELEYHDASHKVFSGFINTRQKAGRPVTATNIYPG